MSRKAWLNPSTRPRLRLREKRMQAGFTQEEFAELLDTTQPTVARWERNVTDISVGQLARAAALLGCPPSDLIVNGDGLAERERELINHLRQHPKDAQILMGTFQAIKEARAGD